MGGRYPIETKIGKIIVFGCGGHARSVIDTLLESVQDTEIYLVDDNAHNNESIMGCRVKQSYSLKEEDSFIIAVGDNKRRKKLYDLLMSIHTGNCISIISRRSHIGMEAEIGVGSFIAPGAHVGPQAKIGDNCIINTGSIIEHETIIGNNVHVAPHTTICGRVTVGANVFCGAGSTIIDAVHITDNVVIGAGAVVVNNIDIPGTYVGVPAKIVK